MKNASVLILAGGMSERMRSPKPFLLIEGKTFIEKISEGYLKSGVENIFVILNHHLLHHGQKKANLFNVIPNLHPESGRFYSIQTGLKKIRDGQFVFIHNIDNPFVEQEVVRTMWRMRSENGFVVPVHKGKGGHPILIPKKIINHILSEKKLNSTLRDVLMHYKRIDAETGSDRILTNINTWQEYEAQVLNLIPEFNCD